MVEPARARALALALPGVREAPHFHRLAFRTPRKIFATLDAAARDLNLMFNADLRDFYCEQAPHAFAPVPGGWGRMGATRCELAAVDEPTLKFRVARRACAGAAEAAQALGGCPPMRPASRRCGASPRSRP